MAKIMDSTNVTHANNNDQIVEVDHKNPTQVQEPRIAIEKPRITGKILVIMFCLQVIAVLVLAVVLAIRGFLSSHARNHFRRLDWYPPMLTAVGMAGITGFTWQILVCYSPSSSIKLAIWFSPLMTCAMGVLLICIGSPASLNCGVLAIVVAVVQSLYDCWASPRFDHAIAVLAVATAAPPPSSTMLTNCIIVVTVCYCSVLVGGIGGAKATGTQIDGIFIAVMILSMAWTMQVIRIVLQVAVSRIRHLNFACGDEMHTCNALRDTVRHSMSAVCSASILVPIVSLLRGSARAVSLISGDSDEFLFSCADCYLGVASRLVTCANRWGFVHVGVYGKGIVRASSDTWEMFRKAEMEQLIDCDLTSSFCFYCGLAGGALSSLAGGIWALMVYKPYATEIAVYAFLIGYFMSRIAIAWPQACVSAYHVAFAENPQSARFDATIPFRLQELQKHQQFHTDILFHRRHFDSNKRKNLRLVT